KNFLELYVDPAKAGWIGLHKEQVINRDYINKQCNKGVFYVHVAAILACTGRGNGGHKQKG
ncbi:hypothetical protein, partial [Salmonella enterica]|uniref:hypothetical protein n=1 Tax=Salmonella enterica TaxID=28901 RepID=UPI00398C7E00